MESKKLNNKVLLELDNEEALVLFDWLVRFNENTDNEVFEDQSEQRVLWDLESLLEKELSEPFDSGYADILLHAREKVKDGNVK